MENKSYGLLKFDLIEFKQKACRNFMNNQLVCTDCIDVCPQNALSLENKIPKVNYNKCTNCGLCISTCEVLAFDNKRKSYSNIIKQIDEFTDSNITCDEATNYRKGIKIPCYLNIDFALLCRISNYRDNITLYIGSCSRCSVSDRESVIKHLSDLQKQLDKYSISLSINVQEKKLRDKKDVVVDGLTRRDLLKKINIKELRNFKYEDRGSKKRTKPSKVATKKRILLKRKIINSTLKKSEVKANFELSANNFLTINEVEDCNGCGICVKLCPTSAMKWQDNNNKSQLIFNSTDCIACKRCLACPENVITFSPVSLENYFDKVDKVLTTVNLVNCEKCGEIFRTNSEEKLCTICKNESKRKEVNYFG